VALIGFHNDVVFGTWRLKGVFASVSVRPLATTLSFSSINRTSMFRATSPSEKRLLHTTLSALSFLHSTRMLCASAAPDSVNAITMAAKLIADFMLILSLLRDKSTG
jgi:hypothetical protein